MRNTLLFLLLAACTASPPDPLAKLPMPVKAEAIMEPTTGQTMMRAMVSLAAPDQQKRGLIRLLYPPTTCRMQGGVLPYVYPDWSEPRAGNRLRIRWVSRAMRPYANEQAILAVSLRPATPVNLTQFGHTDCWLMVNLDYLLTPDNEGILRKPEPGVIELDWVLPHEFIGLTWYAQMLLATPETTSGWAVSPGIEFTIGSPGAAGAPPTANAASYGDFLWEFSEPRPVGSFVTGEPWVVGPVTITAITPKRTVAGGRVMNGSMLNPMPLWQYDGFNWSQHGWDTRLFSGTPAPYPEYRQPIDLSASLPQTVTKGSIVSVQSVANVAPGESPLLDAAVLTVLDAPPPADAFRPPYVGTSKAIPGTLSQVNWTALASLPAAPGMPNLAPLRAKLASLWFDTAVGWISQYQHPQRGLVGYYRGFTSEIGTAALAANCAIDEATKRELAVRVVQIGIDNFAVMQSGARWGVNGHCNGRKFPTLFAGRMLGRADMLAAGTTYRPDGGKVPFSEDGQTFYVSRDPDGRINGGHGGYTEADLGLPEWGNFHGENRASDSVVWNLPYRVCCSANGWVGQVLAMRIMGLREAWAWPSYFDYQDRYMQVMRNAPAGEQWQRAWEPWHAAMWDAYRGSF